MTDARHDISRGDTGASIEALDRAEALDPGMASTRARAGRQSSVSDDPAAALPELQRAVRLNPLDDLAWRTLALAHEALGDVPKPMRPYGRPSTSSAPIPRTFCSRRFGRRSEVADRSRKTSSPRPFKHGPRSSIGDVGLLYGGDRP